MVKVGVLFEVRTEFLNKMYTSFIFKGLSEKWTHFPYLISFFMLAIMMTEFLL
jgi:hypothetical protein